MWTEHNLVHCRRKTSQTHTHTHTHTHSGALQPFRLVGPPQLQPILFYPSFQNTTFTDFRPYKLKICSHICHIQYPTSNAGLEKTTIVSHLWNFQFKKMQSLIFQDILGTSLIKTVSSYLWTVIQILIEHLTCVFEKQFS